MTVPLWDALVSMGVAWVFGFVAGRFLRLRSTYKPFRENNVFPFDRKNEFTSFSMDSSSKTASNEEAPF